MRIQDLHVLPKLRDGLGYLYLEHGILEQDQQAVQFIDKDGRTRIPAAALALLMLGPGTSISHEAVKRLADNGCLIAWVGEQGVRFYAQGVGETRKAYRLLRQAELATDPRKRKTVVLRMYQARFAEQLDPALSIEQIRGMEGVRVRRAYAQASRATGVFWGGRSYDRQRWTASDPVNRALSAANACLNGLCHAAIVAAGYAPGLGFIHTGKQLSFVYDVADLYKVDMTVPLAFRTVAESAQNVETRIRHACRDLFHEQKLLARILPDIDKMLAFVPPSDDDVVPYDSDPAAPGPLWGPEDEEEGEES